LGGWFRVFWFSLHSFLFYLFFPPHSCLWLALPSCFHFKNKQTNKYALVFLHGIFSCGSIWWTSFFTLMYIFFTRKYLLTFFSFFFFFLVASPSFSFSIGVGCDVTCYKPLKTFLRMENKTQQWVSAQTTSSFLAIQPSQKSQTSFL